MQVQEVPFRIFAQMHCFEKADAPTGQQRRIAGVVSTELRDKQRELLLQRGLDFGPFMENGCFNDNHSKDTAGPGLLGYPQEVRKFQKGEILPDGERAVANCSWVEGYLLDTPEGTTIWNTGRALAKAGQRKRLGYSIEGGVTGRDPRDPTIVTKAVVRKIAITNQPVAEGSYMDALAKSMEDMDKGMTMGAATPGQNPSEAGPATGEGAGAVLTPQHMETGKPTNLTGAGQDPAPPAAESADEEDDEKQDKPIQKSAALALIRERFGCSHAQAERAFSAICKSQESTMSIPKPAAFAAAVANLEQATQAQGNTRMSVLMRKAESGQASPEETQELIKSLGGGGVTDAFQQNSVIEKAVEGSGFMREFLDLNVAAVDQLADMIQKSMTGNREFNVVLGQTLVEQGKQIQVLLKSQQTLIETVDRLSKSPAGAPRAVGAKPAEKPLAGGPTPAANLDPNAGSDGGGLSKSLVADALEHMSIVKGIKAVAGEPLDQAITKFELESKISPTMLKAVKDTLEELKKSAA